MIILDRSAKKPLYMQIYEHIRNEIIQGELAEGHRLSATRTQAEKLWVSRNTVEQAYMQLCSEGYLENRRGSGYYVRYVDLALDREQFDFEQFPDFHRERPECRSYRYDMKYGNCRIEEFPLTKWKRTMERAVSSLAERKLTAYGDHCGDWELRRYLAKYLERSRGVMCSPDQIIIGSGAQFFISLLCQLIRPSFCAVEEPGYEGARAVLENHGVKPVPVEVTAEGINLDVLSIVRPQAVYVTPSHQFPMGAVMPIQNRMELLRMAQQEDFYIIEDDYDSVFRYTAKAIPAMQGLDQYGRVIYLGSVSKVLSPALRLAYMVLPAALKTKYDMWFSQYHNTVSSLLQSTLCIFMEEGNWDRHIRRITLANKRKHDILSYELENGLSSDFCLWGKGAGLHLILESKSLTAEEMIVRNEKKGVKLYPMKQNFALGTSRNLVMAGFGGISLDEIQDASHCIVQALTDWY